MRPTQHERLPQGLEPPACQALNSPPFGVLEFVKLRSHDIVWLRGEFLIIVLIEDWFDDWLYVHLLPCLADVAYRQMSRSCTYFHL
jgi:hypothetical protein